MTHEHAKPIPSEPGEIRWNPKMSIWLTVMFGLTAWFGPETLSWTTLALFTFSTAFILCVGHSVGMHRGMIHKTYKTSKWFERALIYLGTLAGMGGPIGLFRMHESRDYWQNQPEAPEFYAYDHGVWRDYIWYCHSQFVPSSPAHQAPLDIPAAIEQDRFYIWLERTWMLHQLPLAALMWWMGGLGFVIWGVCARVAVGILGHWFVNYAAHTAGYRSYEIVGSGEQGRNSLIFGAMSMGEGWHNNHHAWPNSARLGIEWWELDIGYISIRVMQALGLVWDVQVAHEVDPVRPIRELGALTKEPDSKAA